MTLTCKQINLWGKTDFGCETLMLYLTVVILNYSKFDYFVRYYCRKTLQYIITLHIIL
jgi:hypothetical protein